MRVSIIIFKKKNRLYFLFDRALEPTRRCTLVRHNKTHVTSSVRIDTHRYRMTRWNREPRTFARHHNHHPGTPGPVCERLRGPFDTSRCARRVRVRSVRHRRNLYAYDRNTENRMHRRDASIECACVINVCVPLYFPSNARARWVQMGKVHTRTPANGRHRHRHRTDGRLLCNINTPYVCGTCWAHALARDCLVINWPTRIYLRTLT